jgi:hypothetical protein
MKLGGQSTNDRSHRWAPLGEVTLMLCLTSIFS